jgi:ABC-type transport system involved in multi-copper enzyme maturation permease subunit
MIWLIWRQHRKQALYTLIGLIVVAAIMLPTGLAMHRAFTTTGLAACLAELGTAQIIPSGHACDDPGDHFASQYNVMNNIGILFVILPVVVGLFYGAPLVARETEHGTHRLVWTQGISRRHWALTKFGIVGAITLVLAAAYAAGMSWWFGPLVANGGSRLGPVSFDTQGIVPIGYTLFAVALGIWLGTLTRKVLPAMGITLAGYVAVRVFIEVLARPRYVNPATVAYRVTANQQFNPNAGNWIFSRGVVNGAGTLVLPDTQIIGCGNGPTNVALPPGGNCDAGLSAQGHGAGPFNNWMRYQPGSRFWTFQTIETSIFLALTALLIYLAIRRIRRIA